MSLFRIIYAPLYFLGFVGGAALLVASGASPLLLVALLLVAIAASLMAERIAPFEPAWNRSHGDVSRDLAHGLVNEGSIILLVLLLPFSQAWFPGLRSGRRACLSGPKCCSRSFFWTRVSALPILPVTGCHCSGAFMPSIIRCSGYTGSTDCSNIPSTS